MRYFSLLVMLPLLLVACGDDGGGSANNDVAGPLAGMAEGYADYPVGTPLGGYTARCR